MWISPFEQTCLHSPQQMHSGLFSCPYTPYRITFGRIRIWCICKCGLPLITLSIAFIHIYWAIKNSNIRLIFCRCKAQKILFAVFGIKNSGSPRLPQKAASYPAAVPERRYSCRTAVFSYSHGYYDYAKSRDASPVARLCMIFLLFTMANSCQAETKGTS